MHVRLVSLLTTLSSGAKFKWKKFKLLNLSLSHMTYDHCLRTASLILFFIKIQRLMRESQSSVRSVNFVIECNGCDGWTYFINGTKIKLEYYLLFCAILDSLGLIKIVYLINNYSTRSIQMINFRLMIRFHFNLIASLSN